MLETNIYPIHFNFEDYQIYRIPYSDDDLKNYREKFNSTHSFFRVGEFIYVSNFSGDESNLIGEKYDANLFNDSKITSSLIKHIFFRSFRERFPQIIPKSFYPFKIYSTQKNDDLVYDLLPDKLKEKISFKKLIEIQFRQLTIENKSVFGIVIHLERNWIFNINCQELQNNGFELEGLDVLIIKPMQGLEGVLEPEEEYLGRIISITNDEAKVETNEGKESYSLKDLKLTKSKFNVINYLKFNTTEIEAESIFEKIKIRSTDLLNAKTFKNSIQKTIEFLANEKNNTSESQNYLFMNKDGFVFEFLTNPISSENSIALKTPTFIFDYSNTKTDQLPDRGLNSFGPYDSLTFDIKKPDVLGICHKENRGIFSNFLGSLINGLPNSAYFKKGFVKKYDLNDVNVSIREISEYEYINYEKIINSLEKLPDLLILELPESLKKDKISNNMYYKLKAKTLRLGIPLQCIYTSKIKENSQYILNSIALQIYAKMGGTPWVIPSTKSIDREIIIGVGHSILRDNAYKGSEKIRIVGITTFFSSDGQYLLSNKAKDVTFENYFDELLLNLSNSITKLKEDQGWKEGETIRLIFHIFKPIKNIEFEVVKKLISNYNQFNIQFAFVTISEFHPFLLFDSAKEGKERYGKKIGEFIPDRSSNIIIDKTSCLVQMIGPKEFKTEKQGFSNPILIKIRQPEGNFDISSIEKLLFTDLSYITQQIYSFSYLSWRGFLPAENPATSLYSTLIARLLANLRQVDGWDPSVLNFNLKRKKWFL